MTTLPPDDQPDQLAALHAFTEAGWTILGGPGWTATFRTGSRTKVIGARSAAELLERLLAVEVPDPE
jgi:hypothetical protein